MQNPDRLEILRSALETIEPIAVEIAEKASNMEDLSLAVPELELTTEQSDYIKRVFESFELIEEYSGLEKMEEIRKEFNELRVDPCPSCGCNELLCGHPNQCTSED